ncbi:MAG: hypothetical protein OXU61_02045 [Gammaproteobacteria bacterium]|nr:hypothetical protein [Gammaproteobacteria bacterium]
MAPGARSPQEGQPAPPSCQGIFPKASPKDISQRYFPEPHRFQNRISANCIPCPLRSR